jgi:protein phosphatase
MGSRAVIVVCRDAGVARRRFGVLEDESGICYTRTGRRFFDDPALERLLLERIRHALDQTGLWAELETDWVCLDCELMPWSAKAQEMIRSQYAAVGTAARVGLGAASMELERARAAGIDVEALQTRTRERAELAARYAAVYRRYCWPVASVDDLRVAPFHVLASDKATHFDRDHTWHMQWSTRLRETGDPVLSATSHRVVELSDPQSESEGVRFWEELTDHGGEGMVVKPLEFIATGRHGLVQPAVKCRGREYLRLIYGLEYTLPQHLARLRARALSVKRSLALRELVLGVEGLERFVRGEPLRRVHQCVFGVLALESEPIDPRL